MKLSKRILSIVLSALMVVTMLPTFAISASAATNSNLESAISAYESKMDGTVYTNMKAAYDLYVQANYAKEALYFGDTSSYDANDIATKLTAATNAMTAWSAYTATKQGSFADDSNQNINKADVYKNLLWINSNMGSADEKSAGNELWFQKTDGWLGIGNGSVTGKTSFVISDTTMLYDGVTAPQFPIIVRTYGVKTSGTNWNYNQMRMFYIASTNSNLSFATKWTGKASNYDCNWLMLIDERESYISNTENTSQYWNGINGGGFGNIIKLNATLSSSNDVMVEYKPSFKYQVGGDSGSPNVYSYSPNATVRVLNYKKVVDAINANKSVLANAKNFKQGGFASVIDAFAKATTDPNSFFASSNDYSACKTNYESAVTGMNSASTTADVKYTITANNTDDSTINTFQVSKGAKAATVASALSTMTPASYINAEGHFSYSWNQATDVTADKTYKLSLDKVAHDWETVTAQVNPTCTSTGKTAVEKCKNCTTTRGGTTISANTAKEYHSYTTQDISSTCTEAGYTLYTCSNCAEGTENHSYKDNYKQLAAHTPGEPVKENETTLTYEEVVYCVNCPAEISRVEKKNIQIIDSNDADASEKATVTVETVDEKQVATVTVDNVADEDARFIGWFDAEGNLLSMKKDLVIPSDATAIVAKVDNEAKNDVNATVKNNIGANFYIDTLYYVDDPETDITITYNQDINAYTDRFVQKTVKVKDLDLNADMQSIINIDVAPAQIDKEITISFEAENGDVISFHKTVMDYCNDVINGAHSAADKNAAKKVINYAYAVQQYFFINEFEGLRSIDVDATYDVAESVTFDRVSDCAPTVKKTSNCPITASEISIVAVTDTGVRIYYTGDASNLEFQASNGYTVTKGDGYVEISGIKAADLGNEFVVQAKLNGTVVFQAKLSAMSYVYLALQDGKKWSVEYNRFLGAFYEYWQAALAL